MKLKELKYFTIIGLAGASMMISCVSDPNSPGLEYMPDMYRSPAREAYVDYAEVRGIYNEDAAQLVEDKFTFVPPKGTIPYYGTDQRQVSIMMPYKHGAPVNADKTHGLYGVRQDSAGYANAAFDENPIPWSEDVMKKGKELFEAFCIHCHGESGDGDGTAIVNSGGKFPPPNAYSGPLKNLPPGQIFYSITYGKNAMGSHASQVNKEERWRLVHYVRELQGNGQGGQSDSTAVDADATDGEAIEAVDAGADEGEGNE
jgi:mono/diheme cytochrome c family protein